MGIVKQATLYFAIVFGAGFVLGLTRTLLVVPHLGVRSAELIEAPIMMMVIIVASRWMVRHFPEPSTLPSRLAMGLISLTLMIGMEVSLARLLRGISPREYFATRDPVSGSVYYALLVVFAILPAYWSNHVRRV